MTVIPAERELPLAERPDLANWTENYCLSAYDPRLDWGCWLHLGTLVGDFDTWEDITVVHAPGGTDVLLARGLAARSRSGQPAGALLTGQFDGQWTMRFTGEVQRATRAELLAGGLSHRPTEPLAFEFRYRPLAPVWDASRHVQGQSWSSMHHEQPCTVAGWIESRGVRETFAGSGIRDHSRGARDFAGMGPHWWILGQFPSGRAFGVLHIDAVRTNPRTMSNAFIARDGQLYEAQIVALPNDKALEQPFEIVLQGPFGEERIHGELIHDAPLTMRYPNNLHLGRIIGEPAHFDREAQIRWTWDGEVGDGLCERTVTAGADGREEVR